MQPGDVVAGRFEVEYLAGTGAFSTVYRARDRASGEAVALKVLLLGDPTPERFAREARVLGELQHPAIVPYVDHGETAAGERYLAMAWLDGEDLRRRISRGPMPVEAAGATIRRIAEALAAAHERGVVHRDVKPSNVYLPAGDGARATLVDFGVAHLIGAGGGLTRTGALVGTPAYMSPEQARGDGTLTSASDVFALGAVLYECVTGRPCFAATNMFRLLARIAFEPAPRASLIRPDLPGALDQLIAAMTERDPALRPSARAVAEALRDLDHDDAAGGGGETLTQREQRMVSIVVARRAGAEAQPAMAGEADDAHRTQALRPPGLGAAIIPAALREALQPLGVRLQALVDGSLVILVSGGQSATDLVARAARAALATREVVACEQIAIATGVAELDAGVALGPVFDRAAALLAARTGRIVIDEATADLLPGRFEVERDGPRDTPGEAAGARLLGEREAAPAARLLRGRPTPLRRPRPRADGHPRRPGRGDRHPTRARRPGHRRRRRRQVAPALRGAGRPDRGQRGRRGRRQPHAPGPAVARRPDRCRLAVRHVHPRRAQRARHRRRRTAGGPAQQAAVRRDPRHRARSPRRGRRVPG